MVKRLLIALICLLPLGLLGQVVATLSALNNQIQLGRPFIVELSVRHPERTVVVFPDSAADFKPYELNGTLSRHTHTENGTSVDAALYRLLSWDIDSAQQVQLPVHFLDAKGDTQTVMSNAVEVLFQPMIPVYSDTLKLKAHGGLTEIREPFPWLGIAVVAFGTMLIAAILILVFRKPVGKLLRRWRVRREWNAFKQRHASLIGKIQEQEYFTTELQQTWKRYLDRRDRMGLAAMTTTELSEALAGLPILDQGDIDVLVALGQARDRILYAGLPADSTQLQTIHAQLEAIMAKEYQRRKEAAEA